LRLDPANANRGTERGREMVARSLAECGAGRSIVVDRHGTTIGGAKTLEAARALGMAVRIVESPGDELLVVKRTDLDLERDERARRLAYLDNRASELGLEWDRKQLLADLAAGVDLSGIFSSIELAKLLDGRPNLADPDLCPELPETTTVRRGDIYRCGSSRVMCGDATDAADVAALLDGATPRLLITDPPYGIELDMEWRDRAGLNKLGRRRAATCAGAAAPARSAAIRSPTGRAPSSWSPAWRWPTSGMPPPTWPRLQRAWSASALPSASRSSGSSPRR
jgi:hypothetical protein